MSEKVMSATQAELHLMDKQMAQERQHPIVITLHLIFSLYHTGGKTRFRTRF